MSKKRYFEVSYNWATKDGDSHGFGNHTFEHHNYPSRESLRLDIITSNHDSKTDVIIIIICVTEMSKEDCESWCETTDDD